VPQEIVRPRNGARRWINVGIDFQPSELAKVAWVLFLALYLRGRTSHRRLLGLSVPFLITLVPMGLILVEPDLGTALLFVPALLAMLVAAGSRLRHLALIVALGLVAAPLTYPVLAPHQKDRIKAMVAQVRGDPTYERDIGFQGAAAMNLVGAGGVAGAGRDEAAKLIHYNRLPEEHNDMIFAVVACRWGAMGAMFVWALFGTFCLGGLAVAGLSRDAFGRLVAVGLVTLIFVQMMINTGMTIGLLPITGITLPFVSSGGSSMVAAWIMVGLLMSVALRRPLYMSRELVEEECE
jgi:cell division protein FtsW (lipid II flippase)